MAANGHPDVIILDPPRAGVDEPVIDVILRAAPERIVYVSAIPATQARDLALLDGAYRVEAVQPVDMFPHTHHVENVVKLVAALTQYFRILRFLYKNRFPKTGVFVH